MSLYPNKRGTARRHDNKAIRISTHILCLDILFAEYAPTCGIEHGMGASSTAWFHAKGIATLLSYEDDRRWQKCKACRDKHVIVPFVSADSVAADVTANIPDTQSAISLVDGPGPQRVDVLVTLMKMGVPGIAFHDAETLTAAEVARIREAASESQYFVKQHVAQDPETLIVSKRALSLDGTFVDF